MTVSENLRRSGICPPRPMQRILAGARHCSSHAIGDPWTGRDGGMNFTEMMPTVRALPRADKLRLIQLLVVELAREEGIPLVDLGASYPIWSPHDAFDAAAVMLRALDEGTGS